MTVSTFDFSTLYTTIPHDKLIIVLNELIDFCFRDTNSYIAVSSFGARWVSDSKKHSVGFNKDKLKLAVKYLFDNCYFTLGERVFRQVIGIPMGSDPAPFIANLFLYYYENKWIRELKKTDLSKARKFGNIYRFIDDLNAMNDDNEFEKNFKDIYPLELQLKKENQGYSNASFLDLDIKIVDNKFAVQLFDKRDDFPFSIVRMPFISSNMPAKIFYSSLAAEILRIGRTTNVLNAFVSSVSKIISRMLNQGAKEIRVRNCLKKLFGRHFEVFNRFSTTADQFLDLLSV